MLLLLMAAGLFSQVYVPSQVIVDGDGAATARNLMASELLFRIGSTSDILIFAGDMVMSVALFVLLRPISPGLALLALLWRAVQVTIMGANTITFLMVPLLLAGSGDLRGLGPDQLQALGSAYIGMHTLGFTVGLVFLGLGNGLFSVLLFRSGYVPRALAAWGVFANIVLVSFLLLVLVVPSAEESPVVSIGRYVPVFLFEVIAGALLLFRGARAPVRDEPPAAT
jgi:hypothetical protein